MGTTKQLNKVSVAKLSEIPDKVGKEVIIGKRSIALFRLNDGTIRAVNNKCPHKQGPLSQGIVSGEHVFCPLHDRKINLKDGLVQKPDTGCVKVYEAVIEGENVYLYI
ncbi:nitrite reductase small subunit NirD [Bacillus sp. FJAT-45350]|uniref:nitrite reductase small subunit NirD n=1 Tax=Bacillus sp. FJAT-45350 TaxID=2011014 RepID=UPI000BB899E2|nr:nitrite reductase small subunit NirD [Bacillus sp. FJAT-45350]